MSLKLSKTNTVEYDYLSSYAIENWSDKSWNAGDYVLHGATVYHCEQTHTPPSPEPGTDAAYWVVEENVNFAIASVTVDKTGGTKTSANVHLYLIAEGTVDIGSYEGILITPITDHAGITWEVSPNGTDSWDSSLYPANMDCSSEDAIIDVYFRAVANNAFDTPVETKNYAARFRIEAEEHPPAI